MRAVAKHPFAATMIAAFCVAGVAASVRAAEPAEFAGRWVTEKKDLTLDLSRCATGWCGVEVTSDKSCGKIALRLELAPQPNNRDRLRGRLVLAAGTQPYAVEAGVVTPTDGGPTRLFIAGNSGDTFEAWRRTFLFNEVLVRSGDAVCTNVPKVS
jgi:hypothetical protein